MLHWREVPSAGLRQEGLLNDKASEMISETAQAIGQEITSSICEILDTYVLVDEEDLIAENEIDTENVYVEISTSSSDENSDKYEPEAKRNT